MTSFTEIDYLLFVVFLFLRIGTEQEESKYCKCDNGKYCSDDVASAHKPRTDLICDKRNRICKHAHIYNCKSCPFPVIHLTLDSTHRCKAGSTKKIEHHEREDGSGYPQNLTSENISQYAKIISVVCSYEAISAPRNFRDAKSTYDAMIEMLKNQNSKYDGTVIKALLYSLSIYPIGAYVYLANGKIGQVSDVNPNNPKNPIVQILGELSADGDFRTVETDDNMNKIIRVLNKDEVRDALKFLKQKEDEKI